MEKVGRIHYDFDVKIVPLAEKGKQKRLPGGHSGVLQHFPVLDAHDSLGGGGNSFVMGDEDFGAALRVFVP